MVTEIRLGLPFQLVPVRATGFEQRVGADDVGVDEVRGPFDGAVHVGFRRQVHDTSRAVFTEDPIQLPTVSDIHLFEGVSGGIGYLSHRIQVAGIGEPVQVDDPVVGVVDEVPDNG